MEEGGARKKWTSEEYVKDCFDKVVKSAVLRPGDKAVKRAATLCHRKQKTEDVATLSRVTTGGTYKTGGYNYIAGTKETGKYILTLLLYKQDSKTIKLSPESAKEAGKSKIKKYVDKAGVIAVVEGSPVL